jgi:hypothetical protein
MDLPIYFVILNEKRFDSHFGERILQNVLEDSENFWKFNAEIIFLESKIHHDAIVQHVLPVYFFFHIAFNPRLSERNSSIFHALLIVDDACYVFLIFVSEFILA